MISDNQINLIKAITGDTILHWLASLGHIPEMSKNLKVIWILSLTSKLLLIC